MLDTTQLKKKIQPLLTFDPCCTTYDITEDGLVKMTVEGIGTFSLYNDGSWHIKFEEREEKYK